MFLLSAKYIKLKFRYKLTTSQVKVINFLLCVKYLQTKQVSVYDFLNSFIEQFSTPLLLQSKYII
uniref:Uncharacterized protein n=1 Tax=Polysiphonia sp. TaxID=1967842 RepID=A0A1Z1M4L7_9FLOR|nr:hypothetical protein [Polysiphonia sp.]